MKFTQNMPRCRRCAQVCFPEVERLPNREASPEKYSEFGRILVLLTLGSCKHLPPTARCDLCHPRV